MLVNHGWFHGPLQNDLLPFQVPNSYGKQMSQGLCWPQHLYIGTTDLFQPKFMNPGLILCPNDITIYCIKNMSIPTTVYYHQMFFFLYEYITIKYHVGNLLRRKDIARFGRKARQARLYQRTYSSCWEIPLQCETRRCPLPIGWLIQRGACLAHLQQVIMIDGIPLPSIFTKRTLLPPLLLPHIVHSHKIITRWATKR